MVGSNIEHADSEQMNIFLGLWTLMTAVGRKSFEIYVEEMKKMVNAKHCQSVLFIVFLILAKKS